VGERVPLRHRLERACPAYRIHPLAAGLADLR